MTYKYGTQIKKMSEFRMLFLKRTFVILILFCFIGKPSYSDDSKKLNIQESFAFSEDLGPKITKMLSEALKEYKSLCADKSDSQCTEVLEALAQKAFQSNTSFHIPALLALQLCQNGETPFSLSGTKDECQYFSLMQDSLLTKRDIATIMGKICEKTKNRQACIEEASALAYGNGKVKNLGKYTKVLNMIKKFCLETKYPRACTFVGDDGIFEKDTKHLEPYLFIACDKNDAWGCSLLSIVYENEKRSEDSKQAKAKACSIENKYCSK